MDSGNGSKKSVTFNIEDTASASVLEIKVRRSSLFRNSHIKNALSELANRDNLLFVMVYFLLVLDSFLLNVQSLARPTCPEEVQCCVKQFLRTNWTFDQKKKILLPSTFHNQGCYYFNYDYDHLITLSYKDALGLAVTLRNKTRIIRCYEYLYKYDVPKKYYFAREFNLLCEKQAVQNFVIYSMAGQAIGTLTMGIAADIYGRRKIFMVGCFIILLAYCIIPFATNFWFFMFGKILLGMGMATTNLCLLVIFTELCRNNYRSCLTVISLAPACLANIVTYALIPHIKPWRLLEIALGLPDIIILYGIMFVPESPRWLMVRLRLTDAWEVLEMMGSKNNPPSTKNHICKHENPCWQLKVFGNNHFHQRTSIGIVMSVIAFLTYYVVLSIEKKEPVLKFHEAVQLSILKMIAVIIASGLVHVKSKSCMCSTLFLLLTACFVALILTDSPFMNDTMLLQAEILSNVTINVTVVYIMEMFPTTCRATALGINLAFGRSISVIYLYYQHEMVKAVGSPIIRGFVASFSVICALITSLAPTTFEEIPDVRGDLIKPLAL